MSFFDGMTETRTTQILSNPQSFNIFGTHGTDITVNVDTAMKHTTVYACINVKAQGISSVPFQLFKRLASGREKASKHPLYKILNRQVNPLMTSIVWRELVVQDLELRGTHFSQIIRDNAGRVVALYPLLYDNMQVKLTSTKNIPTLQYVYTTATGEMKTFKNENILRIVGLPSSNGILGVTPISQNAQSVGLGIQTETFGSKFFANGANGSGILSTESVFKDESAIARLANQFGEKYTGLANSKKPIILEGGMKWQPITISNNDSQFLETRQYQKSDIASIFRVSPHLINDLKNATFSNIEHLGIEHVKYCLIPVASKIEAAINNQLLSDSEQEEYYCEFNFDALMRGDFESRMKGYDTAIKGGFYKPNEVREKENLSNNQTGDKLIMQTSYATLEQIEKGIDNATKTTN